MYEPFVQSEYYAKFQYPLKSGSGEEGVKWLFIIYGHILIRITCPCNEHPLIPPFYIQKVGLTRVYIFFLFLLQNINCGYSLEPPR